MKPTPLTERLGISHAILLAPMAGGPGTATLAAAVSNAGGLGAFGGGYLTPAQLRAEIHAIRALTDRPFAVNLFVDARTAVEPARIEAAHAALAPYRDEVGLSHATPSVTTDDILTGQFAVVLEERVPVFSFTFGLPSAEMLAACRSAGIVSMGTATTVAEARALESANVDVICAQGSEAGGHRGGWLAPFERSLIGTMALVPQVVDAVDRPVVAAGGIMDGRGIAAALTLGAVGAQLGTAFLRCTESGTSAPYRAALARAHDDDTTITRAFSGRPARGIANRFAREMALRDDVVAPYPVQNSLTREIRAAAARAGNAELLSLWAGQGLTLARELSASALMAALLRETDAAFARAGAMHG